MTARVRLRILEFSLLFVLYLGPWSSTTPSRRKEERRSPNDGAARRWIGTSTLRGSLGPRTPTRRRSDSRMPVTGRPNS